MFEPSNSGWGITDYVGEDQQTSTWNVINQTTSMKTTLKEKKDFFPTTKAVYKKIKIIIILKLFYQKSHTNLWE